MAMASASETWGGDLAYKSGEPTVDSQKHVSKESDNCGAEDCKEKARDEEEDYSSIEPASCRGQAPVGTVVSAAPTSGSYAELQQKYSIASRYYCELCDVPCSGPEPFEMHLRGKAHKRKVLLFESGAMCTKTLQRSGFDAMRRSHDDAATTILSQRHSAFGDTRAPPYYDERDYGGGFAPMRRSPPPGSSRLSMASGLMVAPSAAASTLYQDSAPGYGHFSMPTAAAMPIRMPSPVSSRAHSYMPPPPSCVSSSVRPPSRMWQSIDERYAVSHGSAKKSYSRKRRFERKKKRKIRDRIYVRITGSWKVKRKSARERRRMLDELCERFPDLAEDFSEDSEERMPKRAARKGAKTKGRGKAKAKVRRSRVKPKRKAKATRKASESESESDSDSESKSDSESESVEVRRRTPCRRRKKEGGGKKMRVEKRKKTVKGGGAVGAQFGKCSLCGVEHTSFLQRVNHEQSRQHKERVLHLEEPSYF